MARNEFEKCSSDEDTAVLAAMAACGDFSSLIDGVISADFMRKEQRKVALWLLDTFAARGQQNWPPSFGALALQFPTIEWPEAIGRETSINPGPFIDRFLHNARQYQSFQVALSSMEMGGIIDPREREEAAFDAQMEIRKFVRIGARQRTGVRIGANADDMLESVMGLGDAGDYIETPWAPINDMVRTFYKGLYGFYSRPGHGKSWVLSRIASYNGVDLSIPGVFVDLENDEDLLNTRMACLVQRINFDMIEGIKKRMRDAERVGTEYPMKSWEMQAFALIREGVQKIHDEGKLFLLSKDDRDKETMQLGTDLVLKTAEECGARFIAFDQIHKGFVPGITRTNHADSKRTLQVAEVLDQSNVVVFCTTQENREGEPREKFFNWHYPESRHVFGSDAMMQLCTWLCHLRTFQLSDGAKPYLDRGFSRQAKYLNCFWPLKNRAGIGDTLDYRLFRRTDNCSFEEIINNAEGTALVDAELEKRRQENGYQAKGGKSRSRSKSDGPPLPPRRQPIQSPAERYATTTGDPD
jgi:hypothetical protein